MDPRDEREIEQALASLASDKQPETMPPLFAAIALGKLSENASLRTHRG